MNSISDLYKLELSDRAFHIFIFSKPNQVAGEMYIIEDFQNGRVRLNSGDVGVDLASIHNYLKIFVSKSYNSDLDQFNLRSEIDQKFRRLETVELEHFLRGLGTRSEEFVKRVTEIFNRYDKQIVELIMKFPNYKP
jgi:hypothetical protein